MLCVIVPLTFFSLLAAQPDDRAKAVITKAIAAIGGEANLAKYRAATWKGKGAYYGLGRDIAYTGTWAVQPPDQVRIAIEGNRDGQRFSRVLVINGDKGWVKLNDQVEELDQAALAEEKHRLYVNWVASLAPLQTEGFQFELLKEPKRIGDKEAVGVKVSRDGQRDVILYFDAKTNLLLQSQAVLRDLQGSADIKQEVLYGDYRDVAGIKRPMKITVTWDSQRQAEGTFTDYQLLDKLDEKTFQRP